MLRVDLLPGEAQNAMGAERPQNAPEVILGDGTSQIDIFDSGAQRAPPGLIFISRSRSSLFLRSIVVHFHITLNSLGAKRWHAREIFGF
jgi:hypothetical protein